MSKKYTNDEFINNAIKIHNGEYDYGKIQYVDIKTNIEIKHNKCGKYFWQVPEVHLNNHGCSYCGGSKKLTTEQFISNAIKKHGNEYGYDKVDYINAKTKIQIKHNKCEKYFLQTPDSHLRGSGCTHCYMSVKYTNKTFIKKAKIIHNDEYDYDNVNYIDAETKIQIKHNKCGKIFNQIPISHLNGQGCPFCNQSRLEKIVEKYLIDKKIIFEIQKKFKDCYNKRFLPFDFYLSEFNVLIECQGYQHYNPVKHLYKKILTKQESLIIFENQVKRDNIKRTYAKKYNIKLIEISYKDKNNISKILDNQLNIHSDLQENADL